MLFAWGECVEESGVFLPSERDSVKNRGSTSLIVVMTSEEIIVLLLMKWLLGLRIETGINFHDLKGCT
jgi:hypothetical protein